MLDREYEKLGENDLFIGEDVYILVGKKKVNFNNVSDISLSLSVYMIKQFSG